jgi:phage-related minor tail protein
MPIFLFAIAGMMLFGGVATLDQANHRRAQDQARDRQNLEKELLEGSIQVAELRARARDLGLDPGEVIGGYEALRRGDISIADIQRVLGLVA